MKRDFTVKFVGKSYSLDGGENNFRGKSGTLGDFATFEQAFGAALKEASEQSVIEIYDFRAEDRGTPVFTCDGEYLRRLKNAQAERGRKGGQAASDAKAQAARENGRKGGRPKNNN
jgi:hypothetical protein